MVILFACMLLRWKWHGLFKGSYNPDKGSYSVYRYTSVCKGHWNCVKMTSEDANCSNVCWLNKLLRLRSFNPRRWAYWMLLSKTRATTRYITTRWWCEFNKCCSCWFSRCWRFRNNQSNEESVKFTGQIQTIQQAQSTFQIRWRFHVVS